MKNINKYMTQSTENYTDYDSIFEQGTQGKSEKEEKIIGHINLIELIG